jgi:uncharacterized protein YjiS (DUF1127 family)
MSVYVSNPALPFGAITVHRTVSAIERAVEAHRAWRNLRAAEAALSALSDHQREDLGAPRARR